MTTPDGTVHSCLLLLHDDLPQADRLVAVLLSGDRNRVAVHLDKRMDSADHRAYLRRWAAMGVDVVQQRYACAWGDISLVDATSALIETALKEHDFHHASLLSGTDWPCLPLEEIERSLRQRPGDHIEVDPLPKVNWVGGGWDRVRFRHLQGAKSGFVHKADRLLVALQKGIGLQVSDRAVDAAFQRPTVWAGGSQWWTLQRSTLDMLIGQEQARAALRTRMQSAWVPDEMYFQTLLRTTKGDAASTGTLGDASMTKRFMDFSRRTKPAVLSTTAQVVAAVESGAFFMRKISSACLPALRDAAETTAVPLPVRGL